MVPETAAHPGVWQFPEKRDSSKAMRAWLWFTSDNGPRFEGGDDPAMPNSPGPLRGARHDLCEDGIRVPVIARWPAGVTIRTPANMNGHRKPATEFTNRALDR
jgi:hypothetical protein